MEYKVIESSEIVWCPSDDRYIIIFKSDGEIVGLNFMQGSELSDFRKYYSDIDYALTDFYNAVEPYLDIRNDAIGKINAAIWAYFEFRNLSDTRKYNNK
jgi:hypothetical protein